METSTEDINSLCIFCLKTTDGFTEDCATTSESHKHKFFPLIFRHFLAYSALLSADNQEWCRNACKVISEITSNGDDNEQFFENVQICNSCEGITRNFTDLYYQLKELELRIDWEVGKLRYVMGCADKMVSSLNKDDLEITATSDGDGGVTLGEFRNTLKLSCQAYQEIKKKMTVPMIGEESPRNASKDNVDLQFDSEGIPDLLSPISLDDYQIIPTEVSEYPTTPENQCYPSQMEVDNQGETLTEDMVGEELEEQQNMDVEFPLYPVEVNCESDLIPLSLSSSSPAAAAPLILQEEDPLNPPNNLHSTYICTSCSLPFTSKFELFQHNMANHIGKYFLSVRFSEITNDQFNYFTTHVLDATLDKFDKVGDQERCPFCSNLFAGREKARNHLVVKHRPILKAKLMEVQKSVNDCPQTPDEMNNSTNTTEGTTKTTLKRKGGWPKGKSRKFKPNQLKSEFNCTQCSLSFPNQTKITTHDLYSHPEKYLVSVKLQILTPHQFQNCVAYLLKSVVDEFQKVDSKYQCNHCSTLLSEKTYAKTHLVLKHRSILEKRLVDLQMSSDVNLIMNTSRRLNRDIFWKKDGAQHHSCDICGKGYEKGFLFNRHQSYFHPEVFFESSNLLPSSSENNKQFKTYVRYVLEQQMQAPVPQEGDQIKCGICSQVLCSLQTAKTHLILRHQLFLAEKLKDVQKSGKSLYEIEDELLKMKGTKMVEKKLSQATGTSFHAALQKSARDPLPDSNTGAPPLKRMKTNDDSRPDCNICGKVYKDSYVLNRHQTLFHPEVFFDNEKPAELQKESEGDQMFSKYVLFMLERQVGQEFSRITASSLPEGGSLEETHVRRARENNKYKCNFCSQVLCNRQVAITHLILMHRTNMAEILTGLNGKTVEEIKLEMMPSEAESQEYDSRKPTLSLDSSDSCTTPSTLKRKRGWPKGKRRLSKKPSLNGIVES